MVNSDDGFSNSCDGAEITPGVDGKNCTPVVFGSVVVVKDKPKAKKRILVHRVSLTHDISNLELMLLPCNIESNHWGLILLFDLSVQKIFYDDGFHTETPLMYLNCCLNVLQTCFVNSCCERSNTSKWKALSLEWFGMPDQPHSGTGSASCGIGVLLTARYFSQGVRTFGWTSEEAPHYRKRFMLDIAHDTPVWYDFIII